MGKEINILEFVRPSKLKSWHVPKPGSPVVERYCDRIPDVCLEEVSRLRPIARWVFIVVWRAYCLNKKRSPVKLTLKMRRQFSIPRNTMYRALKVLKDAGIISIAAKGHEALLITVLIPRKKKGV
jgi:hypothetical protein